MVMDKINKFIEKGNVVHNNKYDYSLVKYNGVKEKISIICPIHGEFKQTPHHHITRKQGCGKCRYKIVSEKTRYSKDFFIKKAKLIHNNKYDYSLCEYVNIKTKIKIICEIHGVFEQTPDNHLSGQKCGKCFGLHKTNEIFINDAKLVHKDKYDYSLVDYVNRKVKVKIICNKHGIFSQLPYAHIFGQGCPKCVGLGKSTENFINDAVLIHGDKYDYSLVDYQLSKTKIKITCKIHGVFEQTPNDHLRNKGCPICRESKGESEVRNYLNNNNIKFIPQHKFTDCKSKKVLPFDFYLPDYNTCIEYDGVQHFKPIEYFGGINGFLITKHNDSIKTKYCLDNNIRLIRLPYNKKIMVLL